jgi:hypothetical protein
MNKFTKIAAAVAFSFAFAFVASATVTVPPNVSMTSGSAAQVMAVQAVVGVTADGDFGPMTKAAVMAYQTANGLTADGVVGAATAAVMNGGASMTYAAGCSAGTAYSVTTGLPCTTTTSTVAGCTPGAMFSSTTGNPCSGGTTTPSGDLEGGAGSITVESLSKFSNEDVGEGAEEAEVLAFEIEADDESDVEITSVKVEFFQQTGADSEDLTDYAETISIWMDGEMVGESDADDFSENSDTWSKSISLDDAIVRSGETMEFSVAITALGNLDSGDIDTDDWAVGISSIRFMDGDGVTTTESLALDIDDGTAGLAAGDDVSQEFGFDDFATANDVELEADLTDENPDEGVAIGESNDETEVLMLSYEFTADGSDLNIESLEFDITSSGADTDEVASELILKWGDDEQSESIPDAGVTTDDIVFDDLDIDVEEGDSMEFEVWATIKDIDGAPLVNGDTFNVDLDVSETEVTDESGEDLSGASELSGTANGETQHLFTEAVDVEFVSSEITPVDNGDAASESATVELVLDITALGGTVYLNGDSETTAADESLGVIAVGADTLSAYEFVTSGEYEITNSGADEEYYTVDEGDTITITITATITQAAAATVLGGIALDEVQFGTVVTNSATRSANVMNWADLLDELKSPKTTLVGV